MQSPRASVVIRTKDESEHLGGVLDALAAQTVAAETETIVVDSGSRDETVAIARRHGARVIEIPAETFTFGGALNTGTAAARAPVAVALSGHAYPPDERWLKRMLDHFDDPRVACATGAGSGPGGEPLTEPLLQDAEVAKRDPFWGYSNAAGAYRVDLWRERPFREDMPGTEDKEWAWHWIQRGMAVAMDPTLATLHDHTRDPPLENFDRARREWRGFAMYLDLPPYTLRQALREGLTNPDWKLRLHPGVWASLAGKYVERRR